jgi:hypothetical protein
MHLRCLTDELLFLVSKVVRKPMRCYSNSNRVNKKAAITYRSYRLFSLKSYVFLSLEYLSQAMIKDVTDLDIQFQRIIQIYIG